jgi:hypothetical protein
MMKLITVTMIRIVENAVAGPIFLVFISLYIPTGMVAKLDFARNAVAPNSPIEIAKLNNPATMIPGRSKGNSIFINVLNLDAPRLLATLSKVGSMVALVAAIMRFAKGKATKVCAIMITRPTFSYINEERYKLNNEKANEIEEIASGRITIIPLNDCSNVSLGVPLYVVS